MTESEPLLLGLLVLVFVRPLLLLVVVLVVPLLLLLPAVAAGPGVGSRPQQGQQHWQEDQAVPHLPS